MTGGQDRVAQALAAVDGRTVRARLTMRVGCTDRTVHVNTVETLPDGHTPVRRELRAAARAAVNGRGRHLVFLIPKGCRKRFGDAPFEAFIELMGREGDKGADEGAVREPGDCIFIFETPGANGPS